MADIKLKQLTEKKVVKEAADPRQLWNKLDRNITDLLHTIDEMNGHYLNNAQYQRIRKRIFDLHEYIGNV